MKPPDRRSCRIAGAVCLGWLTATPAVLAADEPDNDVRQELRAVERAIESGQKRQQRLSAQTEKLTRELAALRQRLVTAAASVQAKEDNVAAAETRLSVLRARAFEQRERLASQHERLAATLSALSRLSRRPPVAIAATPATAVDTFRSARLLGAVVPGLEAEAEKLRGELRTLNVLLRQINQERESLADARERLDAERRDIVSLLAEKTDRQDGLRRKSQRETERLNELAATATDLKSLVAKLEADAERRRALEAEAERRRLAAEAERQQREAARRQRLAEAEERRRLQAAEAERIREQTAEAERQAAAAAPAPAAQAVPPTTADTSRRAVALPPPTQSFAQSRGRLPMPVRGKIVQLYGATDGFGQTSKGIRVETLPNAQVVAPSDGSIMFAGEFRGYGLLLIISHGESYHTLLAGMSEIYGTVGQSVLAGEPVGQMGASQGERPTLYVELRRGGEPINPQPWMAANNGKVSG